MCQAREGKGQNKMYNLSIPSMPINTIISHLRRKRPAPVIKQLDQYTIEFTVETDRYAKYFRVHYQDSHTEAERVSAWDRSAHYLFPRDRGQHYNIYFRQELVPMRGDLVEISGDRWFCTEEETVEEIKRLCRNWRK